MAGNTISGIAKNAFQVQNAEAKPKTKQEEKNDFSAEIMGLMNVNAKNTSYGTAKNSGEEMLKNTYEISNTSNKTLEVKQTKTAEEKVSGAADELDEYTKEVYEVLKDELGVTEDEIKEAMEKLGLNALQLAEPKNLMSLVQELTGEDIGALFLSESFQNIMGQVSELTEELCEALGMTKEELLAFCEEMTASEDAIAEQPSEQTIQTKQEAEQSLAGTFVTDGISEEMSVEEEQPITPSERQKGEQAKANITEVSEEQVTSLKEAEIGQKQTKQQTSEHNEHTFAEQNSHSAVAGNVQNGQTEAFAAVQEEAVTPYTYSAPIDTENIIEQIAKNVRVTAGAETTTMEMQLNPENLGKIYLHISEKEGAVRAQIAAQNEAVKQMLEVQTAELRQTLNQQGVKVDAIEVTVATHEFEQNLEGNAKQQEDLERRESENREKQTRKNLNRNDLDGLSGLMTEEEVLAAKIMNENGNQVDLTA